MPRELALIDELRRIMDEINAYAGATERVRCEWLDISATAHDDDIKRSALLFAKLAHVDKCRAIAWSKRLGAVLDELVNE